MNGEAEKYLRELNRSLVGIPQADREEILLEIKSHIHEAAEKGEDTAQTISRIGSETVPRFV